nr:MAG TPA: hypothetical protein [Microviridae sp.]
MVPPNRQLLLVLRAQYNRRCDIRKFCVGKFSMS